LPRVYGAGRTAMVYTAHVPSQPLIRLPDPEPDATIVRAVADDHSPETIDLGVALRLAGVDNPTIALAREQVREALAGQLAARSLLLPSLNAGANYYTHSGNLQASSGAVFPVTRDGLYAGFGARAVGSSTLAFPGVRLFAHLGDAVYEPLAARQRVSARTSDAAAVQNEILLQVATAYLHLVEAESRLTILRQGEVDVSEVARLTRVFAEKGQGRYSDADRAQSRLDLLRRQTREAEEDLSVASAELARLLSLDPSTTLRTPGGPVQPISLIPEGAELESLVADAIRNRPEIVSRGAEVVQAQVRVRQEQARPFLPTISIGFSGGWFGGGSNQVEPRFSPLGGRTDFDALAVWNIQNLGFGNRADIRRAHAVVSESLAAYDITLNRVRREVADTHAEVKAAARQIEVATAAVAAAEEGYKLETTRIQQGQGRPLEVLDSLQQLLDAREQRLNALIAYNVAQFRLMAARGISPSR
jgi:outer membrane protein TolC